MNICLITVSVGCVSDYSAFPKWSLCIYRVISTGHSQDLHSGDETANPTSRLRPNPSQPWKYWAKAATVSVFLHVSSEQAELKGRWPDSVPNSHSTLSAKIPSAVPIRGGSSLSVLLTCFTGTWGMAQEMFCCDSVITASKKKLLLICGTFLSGRKNPYRASWGLPDCVLWTQAWKLLPYYIFIMNAIFVDCI